MANYQSIPRRFNRPTSSINHAYIDATLKEQQSTIDTNFGIMQQTVDETLGQDLIREEDREYLKDKVRGVLNTLDRTDEIRFDSKKSRFSIQDALSEAAKDPEVLRQVSNTKKVRQVQQFYQERLKKGDIDQQNFQYAYQKSGIGAYVSGQGDNVGDFQYLEYVDVDAKMDETARKLKAASPNEEISIQNPATGEIISKKVSMVTPEEMRNYLRVQLNANDLKQLEIDGAMMYGMDDSTAIAHRDELITASNKKYTEDISMLESYRDNGNKTPGEIEEINKQIKALGAEKSAFETKMIGQKTAEAIGGQQLIENKVDLFSKLYTKNGPESIAYDNDYLKRTRDANAAAKLAEQSGPVSSNISTITVPTNLPDTVDPYQDSLDRTDRALAENSNYLNSTFNALGDDKKKLISDTMENIKNDPEFLAMFKGQELSNEALQLETINRLGANFFPPDVAKGLRSSIASTKAIREGMAKTTNDFIKTQSLQEEVYNQLFEEETGLLMVTPQGEVTMQNYLKQNGVTNYDTYKSFVNGDSSEAKKLRATLALQSMSLTNDLSADDVALMPGIPTGGLMFNSGIGSTNKIDLTDSEYKMMRQSVHDLTGESLEETYNVSKKDGTYTLNLKNPETNFAKVINKTNDLYQKGRFLVGTLNPFDSDRTVRNESAVRSLFEDDKYRDFAARNLSNLDKTVAGSNSIRIMGHPKKEIDPVYREVLQEVSNTSAFDLRNPIDIYRREDGSLFVSQASIIEDEEGEQKVKNITGVVQANDVDKMASFNNQISMLQKENTLNTLDNMSGTIDKMNFIGDNREQVEGLNRLYDRNNKGENFFRIMSGQSSSRKAIFKPEEEKYFNQRPEGRAIRAQFEDFVKNTHNYKLDFTKGIDSDYQVVIKDKEDNNIGSIPLNRNIPVETFEKAYQGTPQVFLALYSKSLADKYIASLANGR